MPIPKPARTKANPQPTPLGPIVTFEHPFNMGIRVRNLMFTGGTIAFDDDGNAVAPDDAAGQVAPCLDYTRRVLEDLGGSLDDIVGLASYYADTTQIAGAAAAEAGVLTGGVVPSRVGAGINGDHLMLECEALAITGATKRFADPAHLAPAIGGAGAHHGARVDNVVLVGGQLALDQSGKPIHRGDMVAQARVAMENVHAVLRELGADLADLVSLRSYYIEDTGWDDVVRTRAEFVPLGPANTSVRTPSLAVDGCLIQIEGIAIIGSEKAYINPPDHHQPTEAPFHHGVHCEDWMFVGAQAALDASGRVLHPGDPVGQTTVAMDNLKRVLRAAGYGMDDVVQYHTYYIGRDRASETIPIRASYFTAERGPVARGVIFEGLPNPELKIAFEGIAIRD